MGRAGQGGYPQFVDGKPRLREVNGIAQVE